MIPNSAGVQLWREFNQLMKAGLLQVTKVHDALALLGLTEVYDALAISW